MVLAIAVFSGAYMQHTSDGGGSDSAGALAARISRGSFAGLMLVHSFSTLVQVSVRALVCHFLCVVVVAVDNKWLRLINCVCVVSGAC